MSTWTMPDAHLDDAHLDDAPVIMLRVSKGKKEGCQNFAIVLLEAGNVRMKS
jgi:hypothetical protein